MRLLLDTHVVIWWVLDRTELTRKTHELIADEANVAFVSAVSAVEMSIKHRIGKLPEVGHLLDNLDEIIVSQNFTPLELNMRQGRLAGSLQGAHKDPFDRMLAAQALTENLVLLSIDPAFDQFGVQRLW